MALIDKASLLMVPSTYEAGKLYNVLPSGNRAPDNKGGAGYDQTRADFDFDRGSNAAASRINSSGLIEKYRENTLEHSNNFNDASYTKVKTSFTSGQLDKDGGTNAWKYQCSSNGASYFYKTPSTNSGIRTRSIYAKAGTASQITFLWDSFNQNEHATFDLANGTFTNAGCLANMESVGDGWYRCTTTITDSANTYALLIGLVDKSGSASTAGDNVYIMYAQQESGLVATDYLNSTSVTAKAGVLVDLPRINYDANGENGALLLEPSRQQLIPQSEYFGGSDWDKTSNGTASVPVLTYGVESPEGLNNAYEITFNTGAGTSSSDSSVLAESISNQSAGSYTLSFYAKVSSGTDKIVARSAGGSAYTTCDLTDQWQRFEITETLASTGIIYIDIGVRRGLANEPLNSSVTCQLYGVMLEPNATYATSYIPNHGTSGGVTRAADSCSVTGASDVIGQTEGVVFLDVDTIHNNSDTGPTKWFLEVRKDASNSFGIGSGGADAAPAVRFVTKIAGVATTESEPAGFSNSKIAIKYTASEFKLFQNGSLKATIAKNIGGYVDVELMEGAAASLAMPLKKFILFDEALTDAECISLTS